MQFYNICMVSDFFYPNMGGIEEHIFSLSQCLLERGHKVIVVTHNYKERRGIRWMSNGLKIYYVPAQIFYNGAILPTLYSLLPLLREIILKEKIEIVHGHGAFSSLASDALFVAKLLNVKTVFTDHSLFGFADASAVVTNRFLEITLSDVNSAICVSHIGKTNTVLRGHISNENVYVIPNAVDTTVFRPLQPNEPKPPSDRLVVMVLSRLVYRKGVDLVAKIIPIICEKYNFVDFYVGGDGPKRLLLEELREELGDRLRLFGSLNHSDVRNFLTQGHIFLNASLTEAYCMAIVEAASSGLSVVSTRVGGIPEVLPPELITLCEPNVPDLVNALELAIRKHQNGRSLEPNIVHSRIALMYNWRNVSARTEVVYDTIIKSKDATHSQRICTYLNFGGFIGPLYVLVYVLGNILLWWAKLIRPTNTLDIAVNYRNSCMKQKKH